MYIGATVEPSPMCPPEIPAGRLPIVATVDSVIRLRKADLHPRVRDQLWREVSFPNPEYIARVRFGRWVGATPEEITAYEDRGDGEIRIPRGAVAELRRALATVRRTVEFVDRRTVLPAVDLDFGFELRDYQAAAVDALCRHVQGCAVVPCGGGKTVMGTAAIARLRQPAIVLVHTHDLLEQWRETIRAALGIEAGTVTEGRCDAAIVTIATVQTVAAMPADQVAALAARFGTVVLDEHHHFTAPMFRAACSAFGAKYRFGLSATPERADGLTPLLGMCIGPIVYRVGHTELVARGHLIIPKVEVVQTGCAPEAASHAALVSALCANAARNGLIADIASREASAGRCVLVLSGRVDHCRRLARALSESGVEAFALTGSVARTVRTEVLDRFRRGDLRVVCATSLADEGLDVSRLERLILATPARSESRTIQRLGRLMRPHPGKQTPVLYDLVDDHPMAQRQFWARRRAIRTILTAEGGE